MIQIRTIKKEDNTDIAKMIRSIFHEFNAPRQGTVYSDPTTDNLFELFKSQPKSKLWVLEKNNIILGSCGIYPTQGLPDGTIELVKFYIAKEIRGKGYGKKLIDLAIQEAENLGFKAIYLETIDVFGTAIHLYQEKGFKLINQSLTDTGHFSCDICMLKNLS